MTSCSNYKTLYRKDICKREKCRQGMWLNKPKLVELFKIPKSFINFINSWLWLCGDVCGAPAVFPNLSQGFSVSSGGSDTSKEKKTHSQWNRGRERKGIGLFFFNARPPHQSCFPGGRPRHVVENINNKNKLNAWLKGARSKILSGIGMKRPQKRFHENIVWRKRPIRAAWLRLFWEWLVL